MNLKNKNKGFSLIEIIVTIAIMAIVTGAAVSIYSFINTHRIEKLAGNTADCLNDLRSDSMSKQKEYCLVIRRDDDDNYLGEIYYYDGAQWKENSEKLIGSVGKLEVETGAGTVAVSAGQGLVIAYEKSGSLKCMKSVHLIGGANSYISAALSPSVASVSSYRIKYKYANQNRTLTIADVTGKHYIEKN